jgi:FixJ family two-component response regulator
MSVVLDCNIVTCPSLRLKPLAFWFWESEPPMYPNAILSVRNMVALSKETMAVFLLDDDPSVLKATSRLLDSVGWKVNAFTNPNTFLQHAATHCPDVAILDILMPDMNGLEVQARLRLISPSTRVIVLTARDDPSFRQMAMNAGASGFFVKGVESGEFLAGVKAAAVPIN